VTQKLRVACIGAGYFSQFHYDAWARIDGVELVASVDQEIEKAHATGLAGYGDVAAMLAACGARDAAPQFRGFDLTLSHPHPRSTYMLVTTSDRSAKLPRLRQIQSIASGKLPMAEPSRGQRSTMRVKQPQAITLCRRHHPVIAHA